VPLSPAQRVDAGELPLRCRIPPGPANTGLKRNATVTDEPDPSTRSRHLLVTAGPTQEPIDAVRYIGNRSSGRLGIALAEAAARRGWRTVLLLGPVAFHPTDSRVTTHRFRTTDDLSHLLDRHAHDAGVLVMAAAVADYRPKPGQADLEGKTRRTDTGLHLELEATPDLLAGCSRRRRPGQTFVGFALEPRDRLLESARRKLGRKGLDMIVANPLETMDAGTIEATLLRADGVEERTNGPIDKVAFADWLLNLIEAHIESRHPGR
jgi:phosphopantothenoylcysteine decarboxylase/phosphopantothenate--cysteine ligase